MTLSEAPCASVTSSSLPIPESASSVSEAASSDTAPIEPIKPAAAIEDAAPPGRVMVTLPMELMSPAEAIVSVESVSVKDPVSPREPETVPRTIRDASEALMRPF